MTKIKLVSQKKPDTVLTSGLWSPFTLIISFFIGMIFNKWDVFNIFLFPLREQYDYIEIDCLDWFCFESSKTTQEWEPMNLMNFQNIQSDNVK